MITPEIFNRRRFVKTLGALGAAGFLDSIQAQSAPRREIKIAGRRIKTVDVHAHVTTPEVVGLLKGTRLEGQGGSLMNGYDATMRISDRLKAMDAQGIDVQVLSINPYWYSADEALASKLIDFQNEKLASLCALQPDRFVALATVALQFPELAARQLEEAVNRWGLRGAAIGGSVEGLELSTGKFDSFWAKAESMKALVFMHPIDVVNATGIKARVGGSGALANVIGNPLETTFFLTHMIFDGALDRFPNLKLCAAHGGGYLGSYADRMDHGCLVFPDQCKVSLKKRPSEYLKQVYLDTIVFTPEALRHVAATGRPDHIVIGTDYPFPWSTTPVDHVMATPGLSDADRIAILGGTACKLLKIPT